MLCRPRTDDPPKKSAKKPESTTNKTEIFHSQRENEKHSPVGFLNFQSQEWEISTEKITVYFERFYCDCFLVRDYVDTNL
jgi:hypothetical protein